MAYKNNTNTQVNIESQEIGFKNYNPFIISLNKILDDLLIIGKQMYNNPIKMEEYYINLKNMYSRYSKYIYKETEITAKLEDIEKFLYSSLYMGELDKFIKTNGQKKFSSQTTKNIMLCRKKLLEVFKDMNEQFADNGLIPTPEVKEEELWARDEVKSIRLRKKAVLDIVFGDIE